MKLVVIAGEGALPGEVVKGALSMGYDVFIFDFSNGEFEAGKIFKFRLQDLPQALSTLKEISPDEAVMAGKVEHKLAFSSLIRKPSLIPLVRRLKGKKPMEILQTIGEMLQEGGAKLVSPLKFVDHLVPSEGELAGKFSQKEKEDLREGFAVARKIAEMDIGQTIAWKEGAVVAVEAMEGTDEMIRRAGSLVGDFAVIKVSRPHQDPRFDLPVVGLSTLKTMAEAGGKTLIIEAEKTIFLQKDESLKLAKKHGIKVASWKD